MKRVNCYNCGSEVSTFFASENGFILVKCISCGLLYVNPRPDDEEIMHAHQLGVHKGDKTINATGIFNATKVPVYKNILEDFYGNGFNREIKWLDIGCGHGEFLVALKKFSKNKILAKGVEPNINKQKSVKKRGLDVGFFDLSKHNELYDIISFLNIYSHLPDPPKTISEWGRLLKPGGELFMETGDAANMEDKDQFRPFYLPDHLSFASEKIVINILNRCGFEVISIKKYPFIRTDFISVVKELLKLLMRNKHSRIKYLIRNQNYNTDMFIQARLIN